MARIAKFLPFTIAVIAVALSACGGGSSGTAPPSALSYAGSTSLVVGTAATLTPSVIGTVKNWAVDPALPAGLSLDVATGVISGTPTAASASSSYTVTASNSGGSTQAVVAISVTIAAPSGLTYGGSLTLVVGTAAQYLPTVTRYRYDLDGCARVAGGPQSGYGHGRDFRHPDGEHTGGCLHHHGGELGRVHASRAAHHRERGCGISVANRRNRTGQRGDLGELEFWRRASRWDARRQAADAAHGAELLPARVYLPGGDRRL